jgi:hypothetical protein
VTQFGMGGRFGTFGTEGVQRGSVGHRGDTIGGSGGHLSGPRG